MLNPLIHKPSSTPAHHIAWAQSGAMSLTGRADGPPQLISAPLALAAQGAFSALGSLNSQLYSHFTADFNPATLLAERAAIAGHQRRGEQSVGGSCRLLKTADSCIALNLARTEDWDQLSALLSRQPPEEAITEGDWDALARNLLRQSTADILELGHTLGLAIADANHPGASRPWYLITEHGEQQKRPTHTPLVIDLSALWAGPLCASLLGFCGARVIKVESTQRPDGARNGPAEFFDLMNGNKESLALDLHAREGRDQLSRLLQQADIVIESSRPRALRQMGISAEALLSAKPGMVWLSITGYGRDPVNEMRIAYGDDAGVAAGLSLALFEHYGRYGFCGDAIADPLTGLHAAVAASAAWYSGRGGLLDISLEAVTRFCSEPRYPVDIPVTQRGENWCIESEGEIIKVSAPSSRPVIQGAPSLGADNARLTAEFSLR